MICFLIAGIIVAGLPSPERRQANARAEVNRNTMPEPRIANEVAQNQQNEAMTVSVREPEPEWVLYITGAVRRPGVYRLPPDSRLLQLVEAAGGLDTSADPVAINLAAFLQDGLHVHVPARDEEPRADAQTVFRGTSVSPGAVAPGAGTAGRLININSASAEELTVLRGIGPATAGNIVEHRLINGRFYSVDDLLRVTGIGRVRLEQLRNYVTVGP